MIDSVQPTGNLAYDVEGVTLGTRGGGAGYLIVSAQNGAPVKSYFAIYDREPAPTRTCPPSGSPVAPRPTVVSGPMAWRRTPDSWGRTSRTDSSSARTRQHDARGRPATRT